MADQSPAGKRKWAEVKETSTWKKTQSNHKAQHANFGSDIGPVQQEKNDNRKATGGEGAIPVLLLFSTTGNNAINNANAE